MTTHNVLPYHSHPRGPPRARSRRQPRTRRRPESSLVVSRSLEQHPLGARQCRRVRQLGTSPVRASGASAWGVDDSRRDTSLPPNPLPNTQRSALLTEQAAFILMPKGTEAAAHVHDSVEAKGAGAHVAEAGEKPEHQTEAHDSARDLMRKERASGDRAQVSPSCAPREGVRR